MGETTRALILAKVIDDYLSGRVFRGSPQDAKMIESLLKLVRS